MYVVATLTHEETSKNFNLPCGWQKYANENEMTTTKYDRARAKTHTLFKNSFGSIDEFYEHYENVKRMQNRNSKTIEIEK